MYQPHQRNHKLIITPWVFTLECVEWDFLLMRICSLTLDVERHGNIKKNRKLSGIYTLTHRVRFCLHQKQRRRVLTEKHLSITLGICELSFIKLTLWLPSLLYGLSMHICALTLDVGWSRKKVTEIFKKS